jgi:hypothetical protein
VACNRLACHDVILSVGLPLPGELSSRASGDSLKPGARFCPLCVHGPLPPRAPPEAEQRRGNREPNLGSQGREVPEPHERFVGFELAGVDTILVPPFIVAIRASKV